MNKKVRYLCIAIAIFVAAGFYSDAREKERERQAFNAKMMEHSRNYGKTISFGASSLTYEYYEEKMKYELKQAEEDMNSAEFWKNSNSSTSAYYLELAKNHYKNVEIYQNSMKYAPKENAK